MTESDDKQVPTPTWRSEDKTFTLSVGDFRITVTRHIHYPGVWVALFSNRIPEQRDMHTDDIEDAEARAVSMLHQHLSVALKALELHEAVARAKALAEEET